MNTVLSVSDLKEGLETYKREVAAPYQNALIGTVAIATGFFLAKRLIFQSGMSSKDFIYWYVLKEISIPFIAYATIAVCLLASLLRVDTLYQKLFLRSHQKLLGQLNGAQALDSATLRQACALKTNVKFKEFILEKMDFEQLREARDVLGSKQFKQLIDRKPLSPYTQIWKTIEALPALTHVNEITPHLYTLKRFRNYTWYTPFVKELDRAFREKPLYQNLRPHLLTLSTTLEEIAISFELPGCAPMIIQRDLLDKIGDAPVQLIGFGARDWKTVGRDVAVSQAFVNSPEAYRCFKRIIERLQDKPIPFQLDQFLRDAEFANKYFGEEGLKRVERDFNERSVPLTLENYEYLGNFYSQNLPGSTLKKKVMERLVDLFKAGFHSSEETAEFARNYGLEDQLIPPKEVLLERFNQEGSNQTFFALYDVCSEGEFADLLQDNRDKLCTLARIKPLLNFFYAKRGEPKGIACHQFFANYVRTLSRTEVVQIWGINQSPPGVEEQTV